MVLYSFEHFLSISTILEVMDVVENKTKKKKKRGDQKNYVRKEIKW